MSSCAPQSTYFLTVLVYFLLFLKISICPDPNEIISSADLNPKQQTATVVDVELPNETKNTVSMTEQQYENWVSENSQILSYIALQMEWLVELQTKCPLGPSPSISGPSGSRDVPPRSLAFLIRTLKASMASFQEDIVIMSRPVGDLYEVGKLIRETLGWSADEAPTQAKKVVDVLKRAMSQMKYLWEQYDFLETEAREGWVNLPAEDLLQRASFVATQIVQPKPVRSEGTEEIIALNIDADSIKNKIKALQRQLKWITSAARTGEQWVQMAIERELDNPVYTQMLDRKKHDPDHKRGLRNLDFNLVTIFERAVEWYTCWAQPILNMSILMKQLTPLTGERERADLAQGPPATDQVYVIEDYGIEIEDEAPQEDVKVQEDEEQWSTQPIQFIEDTILKEEDDVAPEEHLQSEDVKTEGPQEQWSTQPIYQNYLEDPSVKEEDAVEVEEDSKENLVKRPNVMSLEDIRDVLDVSTQQATNQEEELFL
ncbi:hypothetical protein TWF718_002775 [Orbilia javanica]|uniref:Uncharacterized protein n=1 Tax=Orbilia javanica TaxID=47235 RepID=A0AAN8MNV3_9PEZI